MTNTHDNLLLLAWDGWSMRVPDYWRVLRIQNQGRVQNMVVGDGDRGLLRISWRSVGAKFAARQWIERSIKDIGVGEAEAEDSNPHATVAAWLPRATARDDGVGALWFGHFAQAGLAVECAVNGAAESGLVDQFAKHMLPTLRARPKGGATPWALHGALFESPAGYSLSRHNLLAGDLALELTATGSRRILLRQVYPACLALDRRTLRGWLRESPFPERRRFRSLGEPKREDDIYLQQGRKAFGWPFHWIAAHSVLSGLQHDTERDRLLIAEHEGPSPPRADATRESIEAMRRAAQ